MGDIMDYAACNVIYVDRHAGPERVIKREEDVSGTSWANAWGYEIDHSSLLGDGGEVDENIKALLATFREVYVCSTGRSCIEKVAEVNSSSLVDLIPSLVLIDIPCDDDYDESEHSPDSPTFADFKQSTKDFSEHDRYGIDLLQWIASEIQYQGLSKLIVPIAILSKSSNKSSHGHSMIQNATSNPNQHKKRPSGPSRTPSTLQFNQRKFLQYLDIGAADVLASPLSPMRLPSLASHAYQAHKEVAKEQKALMELKRGRKRSWVGLDDQKPYAYLREAMVSSLMDGICRLGAQEDAPTGHKSVFVGLQRREAISQAIGSWGFAAHDFSDDELLHGGLLMLEHALESPELEHWRLSTENITAFLVACRAAYNSFVPYHNFRHVIDVLQATFHFLIQVGCLPPYAPINSPVSPTEEKPRPPIAALLRPFDALALLITAIGHDVGHPGVNNAFLVTLNAPLAQLYNDRSVLESFHCAAYSQILRRHWPAAFHSVDMRKLMISSILSTDMGLHFDYMKRLGFLQEKLHEDGGTDGWNGRLIEEYRALICALLIKCADISNVARKYEVAAKWTMILTDEFSRQATMESDLGIPSALFAAPVREIIELGKSQIGFMNMFAIPLFQGVSDILPSMQFAVDELQNNKSVWEKKIALEQERLHENGDEPATDGMFSPRSMSIATTSDRDSHYQVEGASLPVFRSENFLKARGGGLVNGAMGQHSEDDSRPALHDEEQSCGAFPSDSLPASDSSLNLKPPKPVPEQLHLSFATNSAPGLLQHTNESDELVPGSCHKGPIGVQYSLVTDAVVADDAALQIPRHQRSSDTTDGSNSVPGSGDWVSQATSATTSKLPLSPTTQGTSVTSRPSTSQERLPLPRQLWRPASTSRLEHTPHSSTGSTVDSTMKNEPVTIMQTVKGLKKKPSRFRLNFSSPMNFWKKKPTVEDRRPMTAHQSLHESV